MAQDRVLFGKRQTIVHQSVASSKRPQRGGSYLIGGRGIFGKGLNGYAVARPDVVQQKIAERMDDLVTERGRHCEYASVDLRPRRRRGDRRRMANSAANFVKQDFSRHYVWRYRTSWRRFR